MTKRINQKLLEEQFSLKEKDIQPIPGALLINIIMASVLYIRLELQAATL